MKNLLENNDAVMCDSPEQRARIIAILLSAGVPVWPGTPESGGLYPHLLWNGERLNGIVSTHTYSFLSEGEFIAKALGVVVKPIEPPITIGEHGVDFLGNGDIKVGCTRVDYDTLKQVYDRATKNKHQ